MSVVSQSLPCVYKMSKRIWPGAYVCEREKCWIKQRNNKLTAIFIQLSGRRCETGITDEYIM